MRSHRALLRLMVLSGSLIVLLNFPRNSLSNASGCADYDCETNSSCPGTCSAVYPSDCNSVGYGYYMLDFLTVCDMGLNCLGADEQVPDEQYDYCCGDFGDPCYTNFDCCVEDPDKHINLVCLPNGTCGACIPNGYACEDGSDCCSGMCINTGTGYFCGSGCSS